jgi:hypothetical protein
LQQIAAKCSKLQQTPPSSSKLHEIIGNLIKRISDLQSMTQHSRCWKQQPIATQHRTSNKSPEPQPNQFAANFSKLQQISANCSKLQQIPADSTKF